MLDQTVRVNVAGAESVINVPLYQLLPFSESELELVFDEPKPSESSPASFAIGSLVKSRLDGRKGIIHDFICTRPLKWNVRFPNPMYDAVMKAIAFPKSD